MASVSILAQYLLKLDPQKNVARVCFYHFLKNFCDMGEEVTPQTIQRFYRRALGFQYWQQHQDELGRVIEQDLTEYQKEFSLSFQVKDLRHAHQMQLVSLKFDRDAEMVFHSYLGENVRHGERIKFMPVGDSKWLALKLSISGMLDVQVHGSTAMIDGAKIVPLEPLTQLSYSSQLDLVPQVWHWTETAPLTTTRFQLLENGVQGHTLRGYGFQKYETLQGGGLNQHAELFFALKKIERLFIQAETDPFYQELISLLEKSYNMLSTGHPEAARMAEAAIAKGQQALKTVFPHDKLLLLLVTNIEFLLSQKNKSPGDLWRRPKPHQP